MHRPPAGVFHNLGGGSVRLFKAQSQSAVAPGIVQHVAAVRAKYHAGTQPPGSRDKRPRLVSGGSAEQQNGFAGMRPHERFCAFAGSGCSSAAAVSQPSCSAKGHRLKALSDQLSTTALWISRPEIFSNFPQTWHFLRASYRSADTGLLREFALRELHVS
jgi:hypothetical protein